MFALYACGVCGGCVCGVYMCMGVWCLLCECVCVLCLCVWGACVCVLEDFVICGCFSGFCNVWVIYNVCVGVL